MSYTKKSIYAPNPAPIRGTPLQIGVDPKGENIVYANGKSIFIRNIKNPEIASEYTQHACQTTVASWSPSGYYIASGDVQGNVRIWDATQEEHVLKGEYKILNGRINAIAWDSESSRLMAVGEGKERFGHVFAIDTGSSVGEVSGHSKTINACDFRLQRPFRAVTCSDDMTVNFYHGAPYKFQSSISDHSRFVQDVKFSPNGEYFVSVGADFKIFLYDGKTAEKLAELSDTPDGHTGGIFAVSWSPDSTHIVTSSADMTAKIWDVKEKKIVNTIRFSDKPTVEDQQVANLWQGETILSISLSGDINYLDLSSPEPIRIVKGHSKAITAFARAADGTLLSGSYDGRICSWSSDGIATPFTGDAHTNQVTGITTVNDKLVSVGMDDHLRVASIPENKFSSVAVTTGVLPKGVSVTTDEVSVVVTTEGIAIVKDGKISKQLPINYLPNSVAINPDNSIVAVGDDTEKVYLYKLNGDELVEDGTLNSNRGAVFSLAFSPDGSLLAAGDSRGKIMVYNVADKQVKTSRWVFHTARVNSIAWSPDGLHAVSGSLDTNVYVWSIESPMKKIVIHGAHQVAVTGVVFVDDETIATVGHDAALKIWSLQYP
ncbi:WD40 repeat-like protein [Basidiobolus meristosporus CBS 931.73]|uniref:WD40 repeat-like protein n=1 Tax=Basidiobolus meristosporus CBS 931.73 TaxID=1314790 RepID=A0A1Y1YEE6_9FUNG|nr:WD40 repeat-like protein [Basidiobolus meristosporus CBS 931.73]|eukprot:ORX96377.1 WD40 repeat-like protein [Basidiobolus meristosporus CBS 931.73]